MSLIPALTDQLFLMDPYPTYGQLHAQGVSGWDEDRQMWLIWGYAETHEALKRVLSQSCFFESVGVCKPLNS